jgi:hypothetical protein
MSDMKTVKARYPRAYHWNCLNGYYAIFNGDDEIGSGRSTKAAWANARARIEATNDTPTP